jgi:acyl-CoA thioesterase superfamily protein/acyl-Coa thioesterase superfamily protein
MVQGKLDMAQSFETATTSERISEDEHHYLVPDGWQQGRGAFGGLVLGALMNAMASREADPKRLVRAFSGDLCGPALPLPSRIASRVLRRGNNQTNVTASLEQDGAVVATATCVLAAPRKIAAPPRLMLDPPRPIPYERALALPGAAMDAARFAQHYEFRPTSGAVFGNGPQAAVHGWIKERVPLARMTAGAILGRLDAYWPAIFSVESAPRPMATVSFLAELLCDPFALDPSEPLFYRARVVAQAGGYFVEMRELWLGDEPVALNQQSFAMLG